MPPPSAANLAAATLFESWLGHGVGSRLWPLRSRAGLAYGLGAELWPNRGGMLLGVFLRTQGERLPEASVIQLIRDVIEQKVTPTCPHGRPIVLALSRGELERRFGRIQK